MMIPQLKIQSPQKTTPLLRGLFRAAILSIATAAATLASSAEAANCIPLAPADADYVVSGPSGLKLAASKNRDCVINVGDLAVFRFDGIKPAGWELFRIAAANGAQVGAGQTYTNYVQIAGPVGGLNPNIVRAGGWSSPNNFVKAQLPTRKATFTGVLPGVYTVEIRFSVSLRNRQNQVSIVEYSGVGAPINTVAVKYKITVQAPPVVAPNLPQDLVGRTFVSPEVNWRQSDLDAVMDANSYTPSGYLISITSMSPDETRLSGYIAPATWSNMTWSQRRCVSPTAFSDLSYDAISGIRSNSPFVHFAPIGQRQITNSFTRVPSFLASVSADGLTLSNIHLYAAWETANTNPVMGLNLCVAAPSGCNFGMNGQSDIINYSMDLADATYVPGLSIDTGYTPYLDPNCPQ